jgi:peptidoglycan/xylan/chitin deacetylase (PgdA/CDA1 family)
MIRLFKIPGFVRHFSPYKIWNFSSDSKIVYLTFDDGPQPEVTPWVLEYLASEEIHATFFCIGENVKAYPELLNRILSEGHAIGNHSMRHEVFTKIKSASYLHSIEEAKTYIPSKLFRPPYGKLNVKMSRKISKNYKIIMWSWMAYDFDARVKIEHVLRKSEKIESGDILVFHDNLKSKDRLKILLPKIVSRLKNSGFQFKAIPN